METQTVEYKQTWRDDFLKEICAFANSQGGTLYVGIADNGEVVDVENPHKLQEDIPNKIVQKLGIVCTVNNIPKTAKTTSKSLLNRIWRRSHTMAHITSVRAQPNRNSQATLWRSFCCAREGAHGIACHNPI